MTNSIDLAALTDALDPALTERAGELLPDLQISADDGDIDCKEAVSLITALLAQNAALRAEVRKSAMDAVSAGCQAQEAYEAQKAAEAERDALRAERGAVLGMYMRSSDEGFRQKARAEAAETTLAAMTKERDAKVATDAVEQMIRNLRDCANGMGSFKTNRGDFGLCDDAADMISAIAAHRDALNILSAEDVAVHQEAISRAEAAEAERDRYLRHLTAGAESLNAYKARAEAAEAKVEKLRGEVDENKPHMTRLWQEQVDARARAELRIAAAEAKVEKLRGKIRDWEARIDACEWSTNSSLTEDIRAEMRATLTTEASHE